MATGTQYAKLTLKLTEAGMVAQIVTDHSTRSKTLKQPRHPRPGWVLDAALRFAFNSGWRVQQGSTNWYVRDGVQTRNLEREVELCPNGEGPEECREIDPCEGCMQDGDEWGDLCEESMGLR